METARIISTKRVSRPPRILWCCQCLREIGKTIEPESEIGPIHHISVFPTHVVIDCVGEFAVWYSEV